MQLLVFAGIVAAVDATLSSAVGLPLAGASSVAPAAPIVTLVAQLQLLIRALPSAGVLRRQWCAATLHTENP